METYNIVSIDDFKTNIGNNSRLLGIDPGNKNVGLAICDEHKKVATPLKVIKKSKFNILSFGFIAVRILSFDFTIYLSSKYLPMP